MVNWMTPICPWKHGSNDFQIENVINMVLEFFFQKLWWDLWVHKVVRLDKIKYFQDYFMKVSTYFCHFDIAPITSGKVYYKEENDELLPSLSHGVICKFGCMQFIHSSFLVSIIYIFILICANWFHLKLYFMNSS